MNHLRGHMANMNETRFHLDRAIPVRSNDHGRVTKPSGSTARPPAGSCSAVLVHWQCPDSALTTPYSALNSVLNNAELNS